MPEIQSATLHALPVPAPSKATDVDSALAYLAHRIDGMEATLAVLVVEVGTLCAAVHALTQATQEATQ